MAIRIEQNLFYVESKGLSLILENRDGYLMLKHLGRPIPSYHFSNTVHEKDHAFAGNPTPDNRTFSLDTQRQVLGQHGLGDFRKPSIQIQHGAIEVTDFLYVGANIYSGSVEATGLPNPHTVDQAETLALIFEDDQAALRLTLYYTAYEDRATITSFSKIENYSDETVVIHKALSVMTDVPAGDYDVITLQGAYAREKTVRRQQVEQGIFSISSNRGASGHAQTPA
ncbi:MAG: glycoside hydrolase family 36 N-terminal domain-containing protein, partial [Streptococcus sp.]